MTDRKNDRTTDKWKEQQIEQQTNTDERKTD